VNTTHSMFASTFVTKIGPSNADISAFGFKPESEFIVFSFKENGESTTNSTPAPSPTPSTGATVSVTGFPADPTYSHGSDSSPFTVNVGYVVLAVVGAYVIGRAEQFLRDAKRGLGPKVPGGGRHD
jgi:hypothetical protein